MDDLAIHIEEPATPATGRGAFAAIARGASPRFWAITHRGDWAICLRFVTVDGHPTLAELRVFPCEPVGKAHRGEWSGSAASVPANGLPSTLIKDLALGRLENQVRAALTDWRDPAWPGKRDFHTDEPPDRWHAWTDLVDRTGINLEDTSQRRRPGRPPLADELLAFVAFHYVTALRLGVPVTAYIQQQLSKGGESLPVSQWISRARRRGFLTTAPGHGQPGGQLTDKAKRVLAEMATDDNTDPDAPQPGGEHE